MNKKNEKSHWISRSRDVIWHPCTRLKSQQAENILPIDHAAGVWLFDESGQRYLDAISSWWVNLFGHGHPVIREAISRQFDQLDHVLLAGCTHEPAILLAETLINKAPETMKPGRKLARCLFSSDGASAVETALKLAVHYWRNMGKPEKHRFVTLAGGYHGETIGALSVTDLPVFRNPYAALIQESDVLPVPDSRLMENGVAKDDVLAKCLSTAEVYLSEHAHEVAAIIVEPLVQCANRMTFYDVRYLTALRALCDQHDILLIADEIAVGMGRTGTLFASEQAGIVPDMLCLSKGLSGGTLPLSVTLVNERVYSRFYDDRWERAFLHSHSFTGNPIACRAALTVFALFDSLKQLDLNRRQANVLTMLAAPIVKLPYVRHFRQLGMIRAFDVDTADPEFSGHLAREALSRGVLLRPIGNTVYWMPPYVITEEEMCFLATQTCSALIAVMEKRAPD